MAKIIIGKPPKSFAHIVKVTMLDGSEGDIPVTYRYRSSSEYMQWLDAAPSLNTADAEVDGKFSSAAYGAMANRMQGERMLTIVESWGLIGADGAALPLTVETAAQLCDEFPAAASAIFAEYRAACTQGRLGN